MLPVQNEVWLFTQSTPDTQQWPFAHNGQWSRLPDAPFSPRANMAVHRLLELREFNHLRWPDSLRQSEGGELLFLFIGGQLGHACGNWLLGRCSPELWQLRVSGSAEQPLLSYTSFSWSPAPVGLMPFPARCDAMLIHDERGLTSGQARLLGLAGGQRSYTDDSCRAAIVTVNDVWYSSLANLSDWRRGRPAPFSPRRSMQEDAGLLPSMDRQTMDAAGLPSLRLDKSVALSGGVRLLQHRRDEATGAAVLTRAELYADAWGCTLPTPEYDAAPLDCDWTRSFPIADLAAAVPSEPSASLPVPIAHAASVSSADAGDFAWRLRFGGASSRQAEAEWRSSSPTAVQDALAPVDWSRQPANVSLLLQPVLYAGLHGHELQSLVPPTRYHLPLVYELDESELSDASSPFNAGSDAVIAHTSDGWADKIQPQLTSVHWQRAQMLHEPDASSWWLHQAASDVNTTRPLFDFRLGRLGQSVRMSWGQALLSGGHSGAEFSSDWISHSGGFCLWPDDPSMLSLLGPLQSVISGAFGYRYRSDIASTAELTADSGAKDGFADSSPTDYVVPYWSAGDVSEWACQPGHHFSPPLDASKVSLTCLSSGLWMDASLMSIRRCVPDRLRCASPFVDAGYGSECTDPLPVVAGLSVVPRVSLERLQPAVVSADGSSVRTGVSGSLREDQRLLVSGQWLSYPIEVTVDGYPCSFPQLLGSERVCSGEGGTGRCREFGSQLSCSLPWYIYAASSPVVVRVGARGLVATSVSAWQQPGSGLYLQRPLTVGREEPFIHGMSSDNCTRDTGTEAGLRTLTDCAVSGRFGLRVCAHNVAKDAQDGEASFYVYLTPSRQWQGRDQSLRCSEFRHFVVDGTPCENRTAGFLCSSSIGCANCDVPPQPLAQYTVRMETAFGAVNAAQQADPQQVATISFALCPAGFLTNYSAQGTDSRCQRCPAGSSTNNRSNQQACQPCVRGRYAGPGAADCSRCAVGTFAAEVGSSECERCGLNEWQLSPGAERCSRCDDGQYKLLPLLTANGSSPEQIHPCELCPYGALCHPNGTLVAAAGRYLLIAQHDATVSTVECAPLACVDVSDSEDCQQAMSRVLPLSAAAGPPSPSAGVQRIALTGLAVINCCGSNRKPAISAAGEVNLLCADCLDGHSEVNGACVACSSVQVWPLLGLLLLGLLCIALLHRASQDASGSAALPIVVYFAQLTSLFLSASDGAFWLSILNVDLQGGLSSACVFGPMSAYDKITARLLSPLAAVGLLGLLLAAQLALRQAGYGHSARASRCGLACRCLYRALFPSAPAAAPACQEACVSLEGQRPLLDAEDREQLADDSGEQAAAGPVPAAALASPAPVTMRGPAPSDSLPGVLLCYRRTLLRLCFFSYNTVCSVCLACLYARQVGPGERRLWLYPAIRLDSAEYGLLRAAVVLVLVLAVVGGPLALLLYLTRRRLRGELGRSEAEDAQCAVSVLTSCYQPCYWYWCVVVLLRRFVLVLMFTLLESGSFQWLSAANVGFLVLHVKCLPHRLQRDAGLELLTLSALTAQTLLLSALSDGGLDRGSANVTDHPLLLLLAVLPVLAAALLQMPTCYQRVRVCCSALVRRRPLPTVLASTQPELG